MLGGKKGKKKKQSIRFFGITKNQSPRDAAIVFYVNAFE